ncbi:MAG: phosphatase PAP2 family protein [Magnetospiraceae bacterium]
MTGMAEKIVDLLARRFWWWAPVVAAVLVLFPQIDLWVSGWFYIPGDGFALGRAHLLQFLRKGLPPILFGIVAYVMVLWLAGRLLRIHFWGINGRVTLYLAGTLAVGPGLIVNTLFKDNWGRARPSQIEAFGGDSLFSRAVFWSDQCDKNCSFVSGHAAMGFWVIAFAFLTPKPWRAPAILAALAFGFFIGWVRIIQGGHFFSDVVFAGMITVGVCWGGYRWLIPSHSVATSGDRPVPGS